MKTRRQTKAAPNSDKIRATKKVRDPAAKSDGKHPLPTYEHAPIGIVECSPEGRHINVNEEFCRMLGYKKAELIRSGIKEITHEDDYPIDIKLHQQLVAGKIPFYRLEKRYIRKDGGILWAELTRSVVRDAAGTPLYTIGVVLDISERKQVERVLRDSSERLRLATESARMFTWELDFEKKIYTVADNFEQVLGFSAGLLPKNSIDTVYKLTPAEDMQAILEIARKAIKNRSDLDSLQLRLINPENGQLVWLEVNAKIVYNDEGTPERIFGVAQNITERKRSEHALKEFARQQEALYQLTDQLHRTNSLEDVFNAALDAILGALPCDRASILLLDETDVMHFVAWRSLSDEYRKATDGHSPWQAHEKNPEPICMSDVNTADLSDSLRAVIKAEGIGALAFIPLVSNGKLIGKFMTYYNAPHVFSEAEVDLSLTIAHQLAFGVERKRAEVQLSQAALFDETVMGNMGEGLYTVDSEGSVTSMNPAAEKMFGWRFDELRGRKMHNATHYKHPDGTPFPAEECAGFQVLHHGQKLVGYEDVFIRKDGSFFDVIYSSSPLWDNGKITGLVVVFSDNTRRKESEKRLVLLSEISEFVRRLEDPNELLFAVSKAVGEHLHVKRCLFNEIDVENDREIVHRDYCRGVESVAGIHKISDYSSVTSSEMEAGKTVVNHDSKVDLRTAPDYERSYAQYGERAYVAVPLMRENRWVASLWVSDDMPREWSQEDVSLLETIAERTWLAVEKLRIDTALRESEALYRTIARSIPGGGVYVVDKNMRYIVADGAVTEAFGLSRESLEGHTVSDVFPEAQSLRMIERLQRNFAGETVSYETEHNGHVYWTQQAPLLESIGQALIVTLDITERKQAEEALRRNEKMFSTLVDSAPFGLYFIDSEFRLRAINKGSESVFSGIQPLIGRDFAEILRIIWQEPFATEAIERFRHTLLTGESFISPPIIEERANIEEIQAYDWQIHRITLSDGTFGVVCYFYDLSEQKRMEAAVRASEKRYRNLFDLVPVAVYSCDANGLIQEYNQRAVELWGREPIRNDHAERYCGSFKIYYPDGRFMPHESCPMARMLRGETLEPQEFEILVERPDGIRRNVIANPFTIRNGLGEIIGAINCLYDITERKQAEEALRESEERFSAILRQATAGIVLKDAEGRLKFVNQAFCNMLGYTESELLGKTVWELMYQDDVAESKRSFDRLMMEGIPFKLERRFLRADGLVIWVDASVSPVIDATGRPQSAVAVEVDITARKQAEEALQLLNLQLETRVRERTAELQALNESLHDEIRERRQVELALDESHKRLQNLSQRLVEVQEEERRAIARELHDRVGQSLSALNINMIIMRDQLAPDSLEKIGPRLGDSMHLVSETITLVRDVMSNLRPAVLDDYGLEAALQSHVDEFMFRYSIKVKLEKSGHPITRLGPSIEMTFLRIAQEALINIARHARASQVTLSLRQEDHAIRMIIEDNGSGIESWQDANRPGSHGLTIMRERAEAFGGSLNVRSAAGKGTKVEVSIPVEKGGETQVEKEKIQ